MYVHCDGQGLLRRSKAPCKPGAGVLKYKGTATGRVYCAVIEHPVSLEQALPMFERCQHRGEHSEPTARDYVRASKGARRPVHIIGYRRLDSATCEEPAMVSWPAGAV